MKKIVKKIASIITIYALIVVITFVMANRVESLENNSDMQKNNASVALLNN